MSPRRWWPLVVLVALALSVAALAWVQGLGPAELLLEYHEWLRVQAGRSPLLAGLLFVSVYALAIALALPGGMVLSMAGGYLFGVLTGSLLSMVGATLGGVVTFLAVRSSLGAWLLNRGGGRYRRVCRAFGGDGVRYLLLLRLIPIFPFSAVNVAVALLGVRGRVFLWTTVVGLLPSTLALTLIGSGLGRHLDQGVLPGPGVLLEPVILWPSLALAAMVLLAGALRRRRPVVSAQSDPERSNTSSSSSR
ncbi:hypothetical protein CKO35_03990 [Ectothiorhodospira shaposhnikovii]|uniref:TVP38/TMEM64 family protein n=1 Tax=Ectothiorhodospira shaposhnikovii TaxID=1054 RepID=UPI001905283A|nr:TVP38/TMEM64 family protein [Ectothiorhodospira shaposhnikovii]MBK1672469.1 hypothetical protein [Ectothiorhodospira shaposhnikovii]